MYSAQQEEPALFIPTHAARTSLIASARVLVVEDSPTQQHILRDLLAHTGFRHITQCSSGNEALELLRHTPFDIVLLDIYLPDIDGIAVCQCIQNLKLTSSPAIILQTSSKDAWHKVKAFEAGATDYIIKPVDPTDLLMRTIIHLERHHLQQELGRERQRIQQEINAAATSQLQLLPTADEQRKISKLTNTDIASYVRFSSELGGDMWGLDLHNSHSLGLYTADFSGHGFRAALNTFRLHALMQKLPPNLPNVALATLNNQLFEQLPPEHYATMLYTNINTQKNILTYSTAGAPLPLIVRQGKTISVSGSGLPLGCTRDAIYDRYVIPIQRGDRILCYSDALVENVPDLTVQHIVDIMSSEQSSAEEIIDKIRSYVLSCLGTQRLKDDLTLVAIKIL